MAAIGAGLLDVILILGVAGWATFARVVRSRVLSIKQREYVDAVRAIGATQPTIVVRHVMPNVLTPVIVLATATVANNIVVEASPTFLGLGVQATIPSWGSMLADARDYLAVAWWMGVFPGLARMLTVLANDLPGDWLHDYLDLTLRNVRATAEGLDRSGRQPLRYPSCDGAGRHLRQLREGPGWTTW